ncbi:hypothetical protein NM04_08370 [Massilia aurea]|uniref:Uncharacterized protein n=1 Tax=Massilia aurea TaxID=373040 RepID=A0A422QMY2_9BURK|nr:hypothetical protein [Massilia aurea]RNF31202.1 hypothetical protein NM04_08370 [Massilia aurea]
MKSIPVHLFKESFGPFVQLLNANGVEYRMHQIRAGVPMASAGALEVMQAVGNAAMWGALATVVVAFINSRRGRKVIITTREDTVVHVEGLSMAELERVLDQAKSLTAIDPNKSDGDVKKAGSGDI